MSEIDLQTMPEDEWQQVQKMIQAPPRFAGMTVSTYREPGQEVMELIIEHSVPCITSLGEKIPMRPQPSRTPGWYARSTTTAYTQGGFTINFFV